MFNPAEALHERFDAALAQVRIQLGADQTMCIGGRTRSAKVGFEVVSPINRDWLLGVFQQGSAGDVDAAVAAAGACPAWAATPWQERVRLLRRAAHLIEERVYDYRRGGGAGSGQEPHGVARRGAGDRRSHRLVLRTDGSQPGLRPHPAERSARGISSRNRSVLKPYGVWAVIAPFNFPFALAGGPIGAALVAGNTVVFKVASDTAWSGRLLAEVFRDAGLPEGVCNYVTGAGATVGESADPAPGPRRCHFHRFLRSRHAHSSQLRARSLAAALHRRDGRQERGHRFAPCRSGARRHRHRALGLRALGPEVLGLLARVCRTAGGSRPSRAAGGADRGAQGRRSHRHGQLDGTGDQRSGAYERYRKYVDNLRRPRRDIRGRRRLDDGELAPEALSWRRRSPPRRCDYRLWREEKFVPIVLVGEVDSVDEAIARANASDYGLTAGFYGGAGENRGASWTASRPASPMSTGRRVRPPAPGPATSLSAAGRAAARPARRSVRSTTCHISARAVADGGRIATARRSSTEHVGRCSGGDQHAFLVGEAHLRTANAPAQPQHLGAGGEAVADARPQIVDPQVDRAERAKRSITCSLVSSACFSPRATISASPASASSVAEMTPPCRRPCW